jgi:hypothetical protein
MNSKALKKIFSRAVMISVACVLLGNGGHYVFMLDTQCIMRSKASDFAVHLRFRWKRSKPKDLSKVFEDCES